MRRKDVGSLLLLIVWPLLLWNCGGGGEDSANSVVGDSYRLYGINFSPYMDGQDPNVGSVIDEQQLRERMILVANHTLWIRSFGCTEGLERSGRIAHELGLKAAAGAWLGSDKSANDEQIRNLIAVAVNGEADMLIVGSEVLLRGDLSEEELMTYINEVRQGIGDEIPIAYADVYGQFLSHPDIVRAIDVLMVNYYPYWEGIRIDEALAAVHSWHQRVQLKSQGKPVMVSESGWPSDGDVVGDAVPSLENASRYFLNFVSWARSTGVEYFYFEAFDEAWKADYEGPQGAHWGLWNKDGELKQGMEAVFQGRTMTDNWTVDMPGGPGDPAIEFTTVPPYGGKDNLKGQVWHVNPVYWGVAVYIRVEGRWWTKPYFASPLTFIRNDGTWECDITTGGIDEKATAIRAYLVPYDYEPPLASGVGSLPASLEQEAAAWLEVMRSS